MTVESEPPRGDNLSAAEGVAGQSPPSRRGWVLPTDVGVSGASTGATTRSGNERSRPNDSDEPPSEALSLRGGVFGQVADVSEGSILSESSEPVVTLRLERSDPHAGRTAILVVRLRGGDAPGFAAPGDWVEAAGQRKAAYIEASRCVNHTTGAVYRRARTRGLVLLAIVIVFVLVMLGIFQLLANHFDRGPGSPHGSVIRVCVHNVPSSASCVYL
jgi:hypothetical protein